MTIHIYIIAFSISIIWIIGRFKILAKFRKILTIIKKITHVIISKKISDFWKEKVILKYSQLLFLSSFQVMMIIISIVIIYLAFSFINTSFSDHLISFVGIIESSVIVLVYLYLKKPFEGNYSFLQQQLHHFILGNQMVKKSLFKVEETPSVTPALLKLFFLIISMFLIFSFDEI